MAAFHFKLFCLKPNRRALFFNNFGFNFLLIVMQKRVKPVPDGKIEKPEDKSWKDWYEKLDPKEHEEYLAKLGLEKEEIDEWEHHSVLQSLEQEAGPEGIAPQPEPAKKPKKKC